jgi:hypothetical protein
MVPTRFTGATLGPKRSSSVRSTGTVLRLAASTVRAAASRSGARRYGGRNDGPGTTNRMGDAVAAITHALQLPDPDPLQRRDDHPVDRREVVICRLLGRRHHRAGTGGRADNKRVANARLHAIGCTLRYPSFREGYAALL